MLNFGVAYYDSLPWGCAPFMSCARSPLPAPFLSCFVVAASNAKGAGSSEISSCNYPARAKGLRAGMFMMQAKKLCPELIVLR